MSEPAIDILWVIWRLIRSQYCLIRRLGELRMPNGGYPMNLQLPMAEGLGLQINKDVVHLARLAPIENRHDWLEAVPLANLTDVQRDALLFHLLYWQRGGDLPSIRVGALEVGPAYQGPGCFYAF